MKKLRARRYSNKVTITLVALVFAGLWLGIQNIELLQGDWEVKLGREAPVTVRLPSRYFRITMLRNEFHYLASSSSQCPQMVGKGTKLYRHRECSRLAVAFDNFRRPPKPAALAGAYAFYVIIALLLGTAMRIIPHGRSRSIRGQISVFVLLTASAVAWKAILLFTSLPAFVLPVVLVPLLGTFFFVRRVGIILAFVASVLAASLINYDFELMLVHLVSGLAAVIVLNGRRRAREHLKAGALTALVALIAAVITTLIFSGTLDIHDDIAEHLDPRHSLWLSALFGAAGSGLLAWMVSPVLGLMTGTVSRSRLHDLQDLDQTLLKLLRERAPSTWEHSRAIANLAEAAAYAIGANALLVRVGAYYHDVGKTIHPDLFIENQGGGPNPHDEMEPAQSAEHIFDHVVEGTDLLRAEAVPEDVVEFCYSHHGSSVLEYFWHKNMAGGNPDELKESDFTYPGHIPSSRETGIMMIVDAIEAAARTIEGPEKSKFQALVERVMFTKLAQGQLDDTGLSVADLRIIASTLTETLASMYHARIKYPWQKDDTGSVETTVTTPVTGQFADTVSESTLQPPALQPTTGGLTPQSPSLQIVGSVDAEEGEADNRLPTPTPPPFANTKGTERPVENPPMATPIPANANPPAQPAPTPVAPFAPAPAEDPNEIASAPVVPAIPQPVSSVVNTVSPRSAAASVVATENNGEGQQQENGHSPTLIGSAETPVAPPAPVPNQAAEKK